MFTSHMFYGGHGLASIFVDAIIRSVIYHMVGDAMRDHGGAGHGMSGLVIIGLILVVVLVLIFAFRIVGGLANSIGRGVRGGGRY